MVSDETLRILAYLISQSSHLVVFTGAGMSTTSGIPDYRGSNGIWSLKERGIVPSRPDKPWYRYSPNEGHIALKRLQEMGYLKFLISQNVDGLHLKSGLNAEFLAELHGNSTLMICTACESKWHIDEIGWDREIYGKGKLSDPTHPHQPDCLMCGGRVVSTLVDFGDKLPKIEINKSRSHAKLADVFLVLGSSLTVYPAASLPKIAKKNGSKLIIINLGPTKLDQLADIRIDADVSVVIPKVVNLVSQAHYRLPGS